MELSIKTINNQMCKVYFYLSAEEIKKIYESNRLQYDMSGDSFTKMLIEGMIYNYIEHNLLDNTLLEKDIIPISNKDIHYLLPLSFDKPLIGVATFPKLLDPINLKLPSYIEYDNDNEINKCAKKRFKNILKEKGFHLLEEIEIVNKNSVVEYDLEYTNDGKILDKIENQEFDMEIDKDLDPKLFIGKKIGDIIVLDSDQLTSQAKIKGIYKKKLYDSDHYVKEDIEELGFDSFEEFEDVYIDAAEHEAYEDKIVDILTDELLKENDIEFSDELLSFYLKRNDYNVLKSKKQIMKDYFLKIMQIQGEESIDDEEELAVLFSEVETLVLNRTMTDEYEKTMTRRIENYRILNFLKDKCIIE